MLINFKIALAIENKPQFSCRFEILVCDMSCHNDIMPQGLLHVSCLQNANLLVLPHQDCTQQHSEIFALASACENMEDSHHVDRESLC